MVRKIEVRKLLCGMPQQAFVSIDNSAVPQPVRQLVFRAIATDEKQGADGVVWHKDDQWCWRMTERELPKTNVPQPPLQQPPHCAGDMHFARKAHERANQGAMIESARISISYADTIPKCYHTPQGSFDVTANQAILRLVMPNDPSVWVNIILERSGVLQILQAMFAAEEK